MLRNGEELRGNSGVIYKVQKKLREGGMGVIWLAKSSEGFHVILKSPKLDGENDDIKIEKILIENDFLSNLSHPNIVGYLDTIHHVYYEKRFPIIVMQFIDGDRVKEMYWGNPASEDEAMSIIVPVLNAISYLHSMNIIHRDIKPENNLMEDRKPVLIDFGAARSGYKEAELVIGTPGWAAPEQLNGSAPSPQSDIYSIGALIFYMMTGKEPRSYQLDDGRLTVDPLSLNMKMPRKMSEVIKKCLDINPSFRFLTVTEIRDYLIAGENLEGNYSGMPRIIICGEAVPLVTDSYTIARDRTQGGTGLANIEIMEPGPVFYISRGPPSSGYLLLQKIGYEWFAVDVNTGNGVFVFKNSQWARLEKNNPKRLEDGDQICFGYNAVQGPYMPFLYKKY
jgi:serine/threonine protein kinase